MTVKDKNITKCPYCGNNTYITKTIMRGPVLIEYTFDGKELSRNYDNLKLIYPNDYIYCSKCGKRIAKIERDVKDE